MSENEQLAVRELRQEARRRTKAQAQERERISAAYPYETRIGTNRDAFVRVWDDMTANCRHRRFLEWFAQLDKYQPQADPGAPTTEG
jgi:hypothetical protein